MRERTALVLCSGWHNPPTRASRKLPEGETMTKLSDVFIDPCKHCGGKDECFDCEWFAWPFQEPVIDEGDEHDMAGYLDEQESYIELRKGW